MSKSDNIQRIKSPNSIGPLKNGSQCPLGTDAPSQASASSIIPVIRKPAVLM